MAVCGHDGSVRWSPLWEGNPRLLRPEQAVEGADFLRVTNGPRCRPYIDYGRMRWEFGVAYPNKPFNPKMRNPGLPWRFTNHRVIRGELHCFNRMAPQGYIVIEPHVKSKASPNRVWGWKRWQTVADALDLDWVQINPPRAPLLSGVRHLPGPTFIEACRLLSGAAAYVGPEGGLYHAAAAMDIPAVAIFGGFVSPANQGYYGPGYVNLYEPMDGESPCGQRVSCEHCTRAMAKITPQMVIAAIEQVLPR